MQYYMYPERIKLSLWIKEEHFQKSSMYFYGYLLAEVVKFLSQRIFSAKLVEINLIFMEKISVYFHLFVHITHLIGKFYQTFAKTC